MHMADALLSPATGVAMMLASAAALAIACRCLRQRADDGLVPLMGMLGAFVFAAQMINFSIPVTGSSGHLGGGLLLAILLGPAAALVVIASVLTVQALFFADGGLLALGANLFNLGVLPCCLAFPLLYRPLAGRAPTPRRIAAAAMVAAVGGLQLGALGVVLQTVASSISSLPLQPFLAVMLPIHLAIGLVEGAATAALLLFLQRTRPELLTRASPFAPARQRPLLLQLGLATAFTAGVLSWFASSLPDGLEWSVARAASPAALATPPSSVHAALGNVQLHLALLPGYAWPGAAPRADGSAGWPADPPGGVPDGVPDGALDTAPDSAPEGSPEGITADPRAIPSPQAPATPWPTVDGGTSLAGLVGGLVTVALVSAVGLGLRRWRGRP